MYNTFWNTSLLAVFLILTFFKDALGLKDVVLDIEPRVVQRGGQSTLRCSYNLEDAPLYNVKWYRGRHEFYRYTPSEHPSTKIFAFPGVHVNLELSNEHQVVLQNVSFHLSGNFSCEVTTEEPFIVRVVSKDMLVTVLPKGPPSIATDRPIYSVGEILRANCTSLPSRPAAILSYTLNNIVVCEKCETRKHQSQDLWWSELSLELPLFPSHFLHGRLLLRCEARVADMYRQDAAIVLANPKDPVPQRVTSSNQAATTSQSFYSLINSLIIGQILCLVSIVR